MFGEDPNYRNLSSGGGSSQPFLPQIALIFGGEPGSGNSQYNEFANEEESGLGLGMVIYDAPGIVTGGNQLNLDASQRGAPSVLVQAASNPSWWLVALAAIIIWQMSKKHGSR